MILARRSDRDFESRGRSSPAVPRCKPVDDGGHARRQAAAGLGFEVGWQAAPKSLGHGAGDGRLGVGVASEGDGEAEGVLVVVGVEEGDEGLGDRSLAGDVEAVVGADVTDGAVEVVAEAVGDFAADLGLGGTGSGEEDGGGGGPGDREAGAYDIRVRTSPPWTR